MAISNPPPDNSPPDRGALVPPGGGDITNFQPPETNAGDDMFAQANMLAIASVTGESVDDEDGDVVALKAKLKRYAQDAESKYEQYGSFVRTGWTRAYRAYANKHFDGSKYLKKEFRERSTLFVPKTRAAVRKDMAATTGSLFSTTDALAITAGNEADPNSRAAAALMQEIVNYRTDRTSGKNAIKWFLTAIGARQDSTLTGIAVSLQFWKLETKQVGERPAIEQIPDPQTGQMIEMDKMELLEDGSSVPVMEPVHKAVFDRPEVMGIPPENILVDAGADWREPAQSAAFFGIRWPMTMDEIKQRMKAPLNPWNEISDGVLESAKSDDMQGGARGVRSAREGGRDRYDNVNRPQEWQTIWVTQWFMRCDGEDYVWFSINKCDHFLTDPTPVEDIYPWNFGERPLVMGYGSIESHRLFPMSAVESWQQSQAELNDIANLILDTTKANIAPIAVVKRGSQVDLEALRKRGPGTNILANNPTEDLIFQKGPGADQGGWRLREQLAVDFDDLAGQFNAGSVQSNRQLNETVGGMKLLSGSANAVGEYDQRIFVETWAEPVISQVVKLCQYYEHDKTIIGLCGGRAKLFQKFGVNKITDELLETDVTTRIDIGVGAGDPEQRLRKFSMAVAATMPLLQGHPDFMSGKVKLNVEAIMQETFGAAGYRDGGKRFLVAGDKPQGGPPEDPKVIEAKGKIQLQKEAQDHKHKLEEDAAQNTFDLDRRKARVAALIEREKARREVNLDARERKARFRLDTGLERATAKASHGLERVKASASHNLEKEKANRQLELAREQAGAAHNLERDKAGAAHGLETIKARAAHTLEGSKAKAAHGLEGSKAKAAHNLEGIKAKAGHGLERAKAISGVKLERRKAGGAEKRAQASFDNEERRAEAGFKGEEGRAERKAKTDEKAVAAKAEATTSKAKKGDLSALTKATADMKEAVVSALEHLSSDVELIRDKSGKAIGTRRAKPKK